MKIFLILCLASGLAYSDKLDRSYLPPPGSKFSGGRPGDIDVPLEFPKQPAGQPQLQNGKPEIELGINRRPAPAGTQDSQKPGFTYFQKSYPVPKTTTSYAITQTTTFPTDSELDQPNIFVNGSNVPGVEGQNYQPNREQVPSYNQYRPGVSQSTAAPYGTTARPPFPNKFNGPQYLPPVSNKQSPGGVISNQDGSSYPSDLPQHQHGEADSVKRPGFTPFDQQNQFGNENVPSTVASQYHDRFRPTGFGSQGTQKQFPGNQFASSTTAPQYQLGQTFKTPGASQQNQFLGNQDFPSSTSAPQYQGGQRLTTPGSHQENQFPGSQDFAPSTTAPQFQTGQGFTPGLNQQVFGSRVPTQQNQYPGSRYEVNQFPSSTLAPEYQAGQSFTTPGISPTPGSIQNLYSGNQNYPSTAAPDYQDGQRVTPGQIQGGLSPGQRPFSSRLPSHNKYPGQNIPPSTIAPQFQDNESLTTPGYIQEGYKSSVPSHHNQYQYPGTQNVLPSTTAPQYQTGQQFTTGPGGQNIPTTAAPTYDNGQRFSTPGQYQGQLVPEQQFGAPNQPGSNQFVGNRNYPSPTIGSQYQDNNRLSTPGSQQRFESPQQNQNGNQNFPTSTATPQSFSTPGQIVNQPSYPGSTTAPQYQQNFAPALGTNQAVPNQQSQYQRPVYNQQIPSSTATPQGFIPGSQPQYNNLPSPGTEVSFPQQVLPGSQQPASQPEAGSSIYGPAPTFSNPKFPSSGIETSPTRDFASRPGSATITGSRPERPQAEGDRNAEILNYENVLTPEGYYYRYDTSNGIHADETGVVGNGTRAQGGYTYTGDDGKVYSVVYTADENGFQPRGDHLPTPPPIPEAIQRVIDQANLDREAGTDDDGSYNEEKYGYMKYEGPVTGLRPKNRTESLVHGAHIPETSEDGIEGQNRRVLNSKGRRPGLKPSSIDGIETEDTDIDDSDFEEIPKNRGGLRDDDSLIDNKEVNRRPSSKRPKPVKTLTVQDNRPDRLKGSKTSMKPTINSKKNGSNRIQISTEEYDDSAPNDSSEELDDDEDQQDSDGFDVDSDQVNYTDDPNNRTDFHGLNKYLPESKKSNRKNQSGKKRPSMRINKPVAGVSDPERNEDDNSEQLLYTKPSFVDSSRTRIPSRKNKLGQKVSGQPKITGQTVPLNSDDETNTYDDDKSDINENYDSDDATKPSANNRKHKPTMFDSKNKLSSKPKRPTANQKGDSNNKENESSSHEETGYEYTPPQRQFGSEDVMNFPSRTNQKGAQTTVRPFLTKNVYGDENEPTDVYIDQYGNSKPGRPVAHGNYPGDYQGGDNNDQNAVNENEGFSTTRKPGSSGISRPSGRPQTTGTPQYQPGVTGQEGLYQNNPELHQNQGFSTTRRPTYGTSQRPFGRPQSTVSPQYQEQSVTGQQGDIYQNNPEVNQNQGFSTTRRPTYGTSQRPFGRPQSTVSPQYQDQGVTGQQGNIYQNNPEVNQNQGFSTTRRPSYGTSQRPFGRPQTSAPQYQDQLTGQVYVSNQGPQTPGDKLYYNTNTPNRGTVGNVFSTTTPLPPSGPDSSNYQPGQYQNVPDGSHYETTSPSQTSRLGQVPSTTYRPNYNFGDKISSVTVDASGQPIQTTTAPTFDHTVRPTYSVRPEDPNQGVPFKPNVGRFGVNGAPGYQSTSAPIGEDFSGPKQPQRFDPETGYHYK